MQMDVPSYPPDQCSYRAQNVMNARITCAAFMPGNSAHSLFMTVALQDFRITWHKALPPLGAAEPDLVRAGPLAAAPQLGSDIEVAPKACAAL